ncbi:MAG: DUF1540 domain-containing protein [Planctomycetota bacterium]
MATVTKCDVSGCSYNSDSLCHALAITIGDESNPMCDTFCEASMKGGDQSSMAGVGACKVACCSHNTSLECDCSEIHVGHKGQEADCLNFEAQ